MEREIRRITERIGKDKERNGRKIEKNGTNGQGIARTTIKKTRLTETIWTKNQRNWENEATKTPKSGKNEGEIEKSLKKWKGKRERNRKNEKRSWKTKRRFGKERITTQTKSEPFTAIKRRFKKFKWQISKTFPGFEETIRIIIRIKHRFGQERGWNSGL